MLNPEMVQSSFTVKFSGEGRTAEEAAAAARTEMELALEQGRQNSPLLKFLVLGCKCEIELSLDPGWGPHEWGPRLICHG